MKAQFPIVLHCYRLLIGGCAATIVCFAHAPDSQKLHDGFVTLNKCEHVSSAWEGLIRWGIQGFPRKPWLTLECAFDRYMTMKAVVRTESCRELSPTMLINVALANYYKNQG